MKVIVTGGGTAGHVNPALSIAETIRKNDPSAEIGFIGTKKGIESNLVPRAGYPIRYIEVMGLKRSLSPSNIKVAYKAYTAYRACLKILKEEKPDLVVGTGGYVTWPVGRAASKLHIPVALHEANAVPGFAVRMLKKHADVIFVNFEHTKELLKGSKAELIRVGMPISGAFFRYTHESAREDLGLDAKYKHLILSFGGSLGSETLNAAVLDFMEKYVKNHPDVYHIHSTGKRYFEELQPEIVRRGLSNCENIVLSEYLYDIPKLMQASDLVICRSGASTLSEIASCEKASVLVPSPNVTDNQQYHNAKQYEDEGAAVMIEDADLSGDRLVDAIEKMFSDPVKLKEIGRNAKKFEVKDAEKILYGKLAELAGSKPKK